MSRPAPWNDAENSAIVSLYFAMLAMAISGQSYIKAAMIRRVNGETYRAPNGSYYDENQNKLTPPPLCERSRASIEMKLMNCSAAHASLDPSATTMDGYGYRAMPNYQAALKDAVRDGIAARRVDAWGKQHRANIS